MEFNIGEWTVGDTFAVAVASEASVGVEDSSGWKIISVKGFFPVPASCQFKIII